MKEDETSKKETVQKPEAKTQLKVKMDDTDIARARLNDTKMEEGMKLQEKSSRVEEQMAPPGPDIAGIVKEIEKALFEIKFYPVAVSEESKNSSVENIITIYNKGNETIRQLVIYMVHENLSQSGELRIMHNYDFFKQKNPALDPAQLRVNVYRAIFNYNTSIEGLSELIALLGRLKGSDDAAKLLTYHFSYLSTMESEANHMLRAAIIEALGKSESHYALKALLDYAHFSDSERTFSRVISALAEWDKKIESLKVPAKEKTRLKSKLKEIMTREFGTGHYG